MTEEEITTFVKEHFPEAEIIIASPKAGSPENSWGDTFFFCGKNSTYEASHPFPFATIVTTDYEGFDEASNLNRPGVYRLNIGISRDTFRNLFDPPASPAAHDFGALDKLMPHPVYAPQYFVCILNPSETTFQATVRPLFKEAYALATERAAKK